jgi:hypothetical protein
LERPADKDGRVFKAGMVEDAGAAEKTGYPVLFKRRADERKAMSAFGYDAFYTSN